LHLLENESRWQEVINYGSEVEWPDQLSLERLSEKYRACAVDCQFVGEDAMQAFLSFGDDLSDSLRCNIIYLTTRPNYC
jgi:hypothetical protein